jgi:uncharacterized SAM-dependent methyltransferase
MKDLNPTIVYDCESLSFLILGSTLKEQITILSCYVFTRKVFTEHSSFVATRSVKLNLLDRVSLKFTKLSAWYLSFSNNTYFHLKHCKIVHMQYNPKARTLQDNNAILGNCWPNLKSWCCMRAQVSNYDNNTNHLSSQHDLVILISQSSLQPKWIISGTGSRAFLSIYSHANYYLHCPLLKKESFN